MHVPEVDAQLHTTAYLPRRSAAAAGDVCRGRGEEREGDKKGEREIESEKLGVELAKRAMPCLPGC